MRKSANEYRYADDRLPVEVVDEAARSVFGLLHPGDQWHWAGPTLHSHTRRVVRAALNAVGYADLRDELARLRREDEAQDAPAACGNCDGRKCMACVFREVHDSCEDDCPTCCPRVVPMPTPHPTRDDILTTAGHLISGDRHDDYGDARTNFTRVAGMWSDLLGVQVAPWQVAWCMTALKLARVAHDPSKVDSWVDAAGYVALGGELAGVK